jgi:alcohol dehydrogenase class IV
MRFEFATAAEIVFGVGTRHGVAERAKREGRSAFVVSGRDRSRAEPICAAARAAGLVCATWQLPREPAIDDLEAARQAALSAEADLVIAVGGGSVIDLGKAVAALLRNSGDPLDYLEVVGRGQPLARRGVPFFALPTTAGTGAEVTRNAVLSVGAPPVKASLRSTLMLPRLAVVDPELTLDLPPAITASTGMDALTQLIEPYLSPRANPLTDGFCEDGLRRVARSLRRAVANGRDLTARTDMSLASLQGGLALANAGLGAVHGFAAPIGGRYAAPHGTVCAALLPAVLQVNLRALEQRQPGAPAVERFARLARLLTADPGADARAAVAWTDALRLDLDIPRLRHYGMAAAHFPALAEAAARASSMRGNPIALTSDELHDVLDRAL